MSHNFKFTTRELGWIVEALDFQLTDVHAPSNPAKERLLERLKLKLLSVKEDKRLSNDEPGSYRVTYFYCATGETSDQRDYGVIKATSLEDAKIKVANALMVGTHESNPDSTRAFLMSCLSAKRVR